MIYLKLTKYLEKIKQVPCTTTRWLNLPVVYINLKKNNITFLVVGPVDFFTNSLPSLPPTSNHYPEDLYPFIILCFYYLIMLSI